METFLVALLTLGVILVVAGLVGKVEAREITFGTQNGVARFILGMMGLVFIGISLVGLYLSLRSLPPPTTTDVAVTPTPMEAPQAMATKALAAPTNVIPNIGIAEIKEPATKTPIPIPATKTPIPIPTTPVPSLTAIDEKCKSLGGNPPGNCGLFGPSISPEGVAPDGLGRFHHFQDGSVYWHPNTGAHGVFGKILAKWASLGYEKSPLEYPTTDEQGTPDQKGRYNHFQGGSIYWTPQTDAHVVWGSILAKWASLGYEKSPLGYPLTDEVTCPDQKGRYNHFQGGSIYWTPQTDAHVVWGKIRDHWASLGWEKSSLGYPTTDELQYGTSNILYNKFERGCISYTSAKGAWVGCP